MNQSELGTNVCIWIQGADCMRRAGSVCLDLGMSVKHTKKSTLRLHEKITARAENLPCNRDCRANTFLSLNFASEQNGSPGDQYFSFHITRKGLSDHKAT